jgi:DNA-binding XRE family transcriptional regulator
MTTTPIRPSAPSSLADDVRAIHDMPEPAERRRIRKQHRLSLARMGQDIGVTGTAIWQWENRVRRLPVTENAVRYARLLAALAQLVPPTETPQT